jgi:hypothetical protein
MINNARIRGIAPMKLEVEFSGTPAEFILLAEELNGDILDSRDIGDAMGVIISHTMLNDCEFDYTDSKGNSLYACITFDSFQWNAVPVDFQVNLDRLPPSP